MNPDNEWMNCCLYKEYERAKKNVLKEVKEKRRRKKNEEEVSRLVDFALSGIDDQSVNYWAARLKNHFCKRLSCVNVDDCIAFIADYSDSQACGESQSSKFIKYCLIIRDVAKMICGKENEVMLGIR